MTPPTVSDVHRALVERISSGALAIGARLPSCRTLAADLGSNPSTVDRAIQRLAESGLVRTVPRRGTFVTATEGPDVDVHEELSTELDQIVTRARATGMAMPAIREMFAATLQRAEQPQAIAFVECNPVDLEHMATLLENATGLKLSRILLDDISAHLDETFPVIAAPLFHVADLFDRVGSFDHVIGLNFPPATAALRQLALLDPKVTVMVAAPTTRGLERLAALVRQYNVGPTETFLTGIDPPERLATAGVLVRTNAVRIRPEHLRSVSQEIVIEWELDPFSAKAFRSRANAALRRQSDVP
ncbi:GntR family transcriptional regulator [Acrocarpospora sp. B8E8]|uniref:GntR family transcriptional regulator n=1 Tax=Acrocarpospora sp. B8E8 TaxID=3153572 RepID=UPI00325CF23C